MSTEDQQKFEAELTWCLEQLQASLASGKLSQKQGKLEICYPFKGYLHEQLNFCRFLSRDNDKKRQKIIVRVNRPTSNQRYYTMGFTF
jgi:hypothetical protein